MNNVKDNKELPVATVTGHVSPELHVCFCGKRKRAVLTHKGGDVWDISYMCEKEWEMSYYPITGTAWPPGLRWPEAAPIVEEWL